MRIWKLPYMFVFIQKQYNESFAFFYPQELSSYFPVKFVNFLKSRLIFLTYSIVSECL